jgi:transposase
MRLICSRTPHAQAPPSGEPRSRRLDAPPRNILIHDLQAVIPERADQKKHRTARSRAGGRPPAFDPARYKDRNAVERCYAKLMQSRAVATRYDKRQQIFEGTIDIASIRICLRDPVP